MSSLGFRVYFFFFSFSLSPPPWLLSKIPRWSKRESGQIIIQFLFFFFPGSRRAGPRALAYISLIFTQHRATLFVCVCYFLSWAKERVIHQRSIKCIWVFNGPPLPWCLTLKKAQKKKKNLKIKKRFFNWFFPFSACTSAHYNDQHLRFEHFINSLDCVYLNPSFFFPHFSNGFIFFFFFSFHLNSHLDQLILETNQIKRVNSVCV